MQLKGYFLNILARIIWGWSAMYIAKSPDIAISQVYLNRVLWATLSLLIISVVIYRKKNWFIELFSTRKFLKTLPGAILIGINWFTVIQCIKLGDIVTAAVGFYMAPIVSISIGYVLFKEHNGLKSILALVLCTCGVFLILDGNNNHFNSGYVVVISLSSAFYAALRRGNKLGAFETNIIEGVIILIITIFFVKFKLHTGLEIKTHDYNYYFPLLGIMTSIPMVLYIASLRMIKVNVAGYFQYITPSVMLVFGLIFLKSEISHQMWLGFGLLWIAICINLFPTELILRRRYAPIKHNTK